MDKFVVSLHACAVRVDPMMRSETVRESLPSGDREMKGRLSGTGTVAYITLSQ